MDIHTRKKDHIKFTVDGQSEYSISSGFENFILRHNALPEIDLEDVTTESELFGRTFGMPLFISSMTGGTTESGQVNAVIAQLCQEFNIPMGVGSQRIMLEDQSAAHSFEVVRNTAPDIFIAANIGGPQIIEGVDHKFVERLVKPIQANAVIVHLNCLQELMQPEGDRQFKGILNGINQLVDTTELPIIVKETGAGISVDVADKLYKVGVRCIDIAGSGGTSWSKVENFRHPQGGTMDIFNDWGIPTVQCLMELRDSGHEDLVIIASGGIRTPLDILKSLCLGARFTATAQPVIKAVHQSGINGLRQLLTLWQQQIRFGLLLTGVKNIYELNDRMLIRTM